LQRAVQKPKAARAKEDKIALGDGGEKMQQGLAKLTLTVMDLIRQVMERQAMRRVESGTLTDEEVERMGVAFMNLDDEMAKVTKSLGLRPKDLEATLGSLLKTGGKASLVDVLDQLIDTGAVVAGQVKLSVSDVDLVGVDLLAMLYPIYGERRWLDDRPVALHG
jgi:hypothetical protein